MVMCQAEAEQQGMIVCCVVGGERSNNGDIYLKIVKASSSLNYSIQGKQGFADTTVPW